jgi:hypothetical protein
MKEFKKCKRCSKDFEFQKESICEDCLKDLWVQAQQQAVKEYEKNYGSWEEADKYEREDYVFAAYFKLMKQY